MSKSHLRMFVTILALPGLLMAQEPGGHVVGQGPAQGGGLVSRMNRTEVDLSKHNTAIKELMSQLIADKKESIQQEQKAINELLEKLESTGTKEGAGYIVLSAGALALIATLVASVRAPAYRGKVAYLSSAGILSTVTAAGGGYMIYLTREERDSLHLALAEAAVKLKGKQALLTSLESKFNERFGSTTPAKTN